MHGKTGGDMQMARTIQISQTQVLIMIKRLTRYRMGWKFTHGEKRDIILNYGRITSCVA